MRDSNSKGLYPIIQTQSPQKRGGGWVCGWGEGWGAPRRLVGYPVANQVHDCCVTCQLVKYPYLPPFLSLGRLCQRSPLTAPVSLLRVGSTQRRATAVPFGQASKWTPHTGAVGGGRLRFVAESGTDIPPLIAAATATAASTSHQRQQASHSVTDNGVGFKIPVPEM